DNRLAAKALHSAAVANKKRLLSISAENNKITDIELLELMQDYKIPHVATKIVRNWEQAEVAATELGYPLVLKASNELLAHKTDLKAVHVDIRSAQELRKKMTKLQEKLYLLTKVEYPPVLLQPFVTPAPRLEVFVGAKRDG